MMKDSFRDWLPWITIFLFAFAINIDAKSEEDQSERLNVLRSGIDESIRNAQFKCAYSYSIYIVDSQEEAERFDTSNGEQVLFATGSLIKSKTMTYESFEIDDTKTKEEFRSFDHITVTNLDLRANYVKQAQNAPHRTLFVLELKKTKSGIPLLDQAYAPIVCPLAILGSREYPNSVDLYLRMLTIHPNETRLNFSQDKEYTTISKHKDIPNMEASDSYLILSNENPYPVVISENRITHNYANNMDFHHTIKVFDQIDTGNGIILPKKIYSANGPIWFPEKISSEEGLIIFNHFSEAQGKWLIRKWESDDLGKETPKESDFFIHLVDEGTDFGGLALDLEAELNKNPPEYFDLNQFSFDDLQNHSELEATMPKPKSHKVFRSILILLGVIFIGVGLFLKWKSTRESSAN